MLARVIFAKAQDGSSFVCLFAFIVLCMRVSVNVGDGKMCMCVWCWVVENESTLWPTRKQTLKKTILRTSNVFMLMYNGIETTQYIHTHISIYMEHVPIRIRIHTNWLTLTNTLYMYMYMYIHGHLNENEIVV